jgi:tetrahydromethanopterin S-methyltransferase subunit G
MFNSKQNNLKDVDNSQFQELISRFDKLESRMDKIESNSVHKDQFQELLFKFDNLNSKVDVNIEALDKRLSQTTTLMVVFNVTVVLSIFAALMTLVIKVIFID